MPPDAGVIFDAEPRDLSFFRPDAEPRDLSFPPFDGGPRPDAGFDPVDVGRADLGRVLPGETCELPMDFVGAQVDGDTSRSVHRTRLRCSGFGGASRAPEQWWRRAKTPERHLILELGTEGWPGVLEVRTATCSAVLPACAESPPLVEFPAANDDLQIGIEAFSNAAGRYLLSAREGPPLALPAPGAQCSSAPLISLPYRGERQHNFGANDSPPIGCPMHAPVYRRIRLSQDADLRAFAHPQGAQGLVVALLDSCGGRVLGCTQANKREEGALLQQSSLTAGEYILVVGSRTLDPPGSFSLNATHESSCVQDQDCPLEQSCTVSGCQNYPSGYVVQTMSAPISDLGTLVRTATISHSGAVDSVYARIWLEHSHPEELQVELTSPGPQGITVRLRALGQKRTHTIYGVDLNADGPGRLADFRLANPAGGWKLRIRDSRAGDQGRLRAFILGVQ